MSNIKISGHIKDPFKIAHNNSTKIRDENIQTEPVGFLKDAFQRFVKNKSSLIAFWIISTIIILAIIGPYFNSYSYKQQDVKLAYLPPRIPVIEKLGIFDGSRTRKIRYTSIEEKYKDSLIKILEEYEINGIKMVNIKFNDYIFKNAHDKYFIFGTDSIGRDQWTRLWRGVRISLLIAVISMCVNIFIGVVYGAISGYFGGAVDLIMQRIIEVIGAIPMIVLIILFILYYGSGVLPIALALCLQGWIGMSRMIRAQFYKYKRMEYVLAARTLGARDINLIFRHILPNAIGVIITMAAVAIPSAIFAESFLAYLGLSVQAPEPTIGVLLSEGQKVLLDHPYLTLFPALVISLLMISFNLLGNGLRDAFNPTLRGTE